MEAQKIMPCKGKTGWRAGFGVPFQGEGRSVLSSEGDALGYYGSGLRPDATWFARNDKRDALAFSLVSPSLMPSEVDMPQESLWDESLRPDQSRPVGIDLALPEQELRIHWSDGVKSVFTMRFLRQNCPCASCRTEREKQ